MGKKCSFCKARNDDFVLPDWIDKEAWDGYMEVREIKKYPMTKRAMTLLVNKLEKYKMDNMDPIDVLDKATVTGTNSVWPVENRRFVQDKTRKLVY